jgi:asparagine synthase (glutamine-hydrolysing)
MCGICGKASLVNDGRNHRPVVEAMSDAIAHRGPDDFGIYADGQATLGHRRLAIIDLSTGKQPISNEDGSVWIVFNGEIYNYRELRKNLMARGHSFATATDTEVIVHLYEELGVECVSHLQGMFAFAIWDSNQRLLFLARDRVGIKPLYYAKTSRSLLFASELKALLVDPECPRDVNLPAVDSFLTFYYTPGCETLFRSIQKLEPGQYLTLCDGSVSLRQYWDLKFAEGTRNLSFAQAKEELLDLLDRTVEAHMISDVPVGVLLSGGLDSSAVLSFVAQHTAKPVSTFTIGFDDNYFVDERPYAQLAAKQFGADHHEITLSAEQFRDFLPKYVWHMEEAVCEPPAVALYFVTKLARDQGIKVVLSGEGGDEAFAGYETYPKQLCIERVRGMGSIWSELASIVAGTVACFTGQQRFTRMAHLLKMPLEDRYFSRTADPTSYFQQVKEQLYTTDFKAAMIGDGSNNIADLFGKVSAKTALSRMLYVDSKTWLPDDLLIKADKMTMANSVELRVPLLDHQLLEFAAALPDHFKVKGLKTKYILKETLRGRLPNTVISRKKAGFPVPVVKWINTELRNYVCDILTESRTTARGYWKLSCIESMLRDGRQGHLAAELFSLLTIELWHRQFVDSLPVPVAVRS